ncbi:anti-sigma factor domain-containing protein [Agromyces sp. GXQ0307]|uniref:anti-sigma factor n=1 Tax=Agromyces sp. GXQ0307 TaxID=3377835 RepID=UPI00383B8761
MTDSESPERRDHDDIDAMLAAYALDAVTDEERALIEARLAESPELRAELDAHRAAAAVLGEAADAVEPRPSLKTSIFAALDDVPQLPAEPSATAPEPEPVVERGPEPGGPPASGAGPAELAARRRWFRRPAAIIAAAAAAVLVVAGAIVGVNWPGPAGWGAQREVQAIASAPDAETTTVASANGGEVTVVWSEALGRSAVRAAELPDVGDDSTYELWYIDEAGARAAGTFDPDDGTAYVVLDGEFTPGVVVGMTIEPTGGSEAPTTDPIVVVET